MYVRKCVSNITTNCLTYVSHLFTYLTFIHQYTYRYVVHFGSARYMQSKALVGHHDILSQARSDESKSFCPIWEVQRVYRP